MSTAEDRARELIEEIRDIGNFDEFTDDREPDKINVQLVNIIAEYLDAAMRDQRHACAEAVAGLKSIHDTSELPMVHKYEAEQVVKYTEIK
jgi:hypothetical protein